MDDDFEYELEKINHRRHRLAVFRKKARMQRKDNLKWWDSIRIMKKHGVFFHSDKTWQNRSIRRTKGYQQTVSLIINEGIELYEKEKGDKHVE